VNVCNSKEQKQHVMFYTVLGLWQSNLSVQSHTVIYSMQKGKSVPV